VLRLKALSPASIQPSGGGFETRGRPRRTRRRRRRRRQAANGGPKHVEFRGSPPTFRPRPRSGPAQAQAASGAGGRWHKWPSACRCCNSKGACCHDQSSRRNQATFELGAQPPCWPGLRISAGYCSPPWWVSVRCGSPGAGSARPKNSSMRCGHGAAPALACVQQAACVSLRRQRRPRGQQARSAAADCPAARNSAPSSPSSVERPARRAVELEPVRTHPHIRGQRARPETAARPTPTEGKPPPAREGPWKPRALSKELNTGLSARGRFPNLWASCARLDAGLGLWLVGKTISTSSAARP